MIDKTQAEKLYATSALPAGIDAPTAKSEAKGANAPGDIVGISDAAHAKAIQGPGQSQLTLSKPAVRGSSAVGAAVSASSERRPPAIETKPATKDQAAGPSTTQVVKKTLLGAFIGVLFATFFLSAAPFALLFTAVAGGLMGYVTSRPAPSDDTRPRHPRPDRPERWYRYERW